MHPVAPAVYQGPRPLPIKMDCTLLIKRAVAFALIVLSFGFINKTPNGKRAMYHLWFPLGKWKETAATMAQAKKVFIYDNPHCRVKYPATWKIEQKDGECFASAFLNCSERISMRVERYDSKDDGAYSPVGVKNLKQDTRKLSDRIKATGSYVAQRNGNLERFFFAEERYLDPKDNSKVICVRCTADHWNKDVQIIFDRIFGSFKLKGDEITR